jgi:hypothetical protein
MLLVNDSKDKKWDFISKNETTFFYYEIKAFLGKVVLREYTKYINKLWLNSESNMWLQNDYKKLENLHRYLILNTKWILLPSNKRQTFTLITWHWTQYLKLM